MAQCRQRETKAKHLFIHARRPVVPAVRLLLTAIDAGCPGDWPRAGLDMCRDAGDATPDQVGDQACVFILSRIWLPELKQRYPTQFKADAGIYDAAHSPFYIDERINPEGSKVADLSKYDEQDHLAHLRAQVADWEDTCKALARYLKEVSVPQIEECNGDVPVDELEEVHPPEQDMLTEWAKLPTLKGKFPYGWGRWIEACRFWHISLEGEPNKWLGPIRDCMLRLFGTDYTEEELKGWLFRKFGMDPVSADKMRLKKLASLLRAELAAASPTEPPAWVQASISQPENIPTTQDPRVVPNERSEQPTIDVLFQMGAVSLEDLKAIPREERPTGEVLAARAIGRDCDGQYKAVLSYMVKLGWLDTGRRHGLSGGYFLTPEGLKFVRKPRSSSRSGPGQD